MQADKPDPSNFYSEAELDAAAERAAKDLERYEAEGRKGISFEELKKRMHNAVERVKAEQAADKRKTA